MRPLAPPGKPRRPALRLEGVVAGASRPARAAQVPRRPPPCSRDRGALVRVSEPRWIAGCARDDVALGWIAMHDLHTDPRNLVMGAIAGQGALGVQHAAQALYDAGGKDLLGSTVPAGVRRVGTRGALDAVTVRAPTLLVEGAAEAAAAAVPPVLRAFTVSASTITGQTARAAGAQVLRGALRSGGVGLVIDGAIGAVTGALAYRRGSMTGKQACMHTAIEAGTGAVSTATGVALAAGVIALTGALAAPAVLAIGAGGALATKLGLGRLLRRAPAVAALGATAAA